MWPKKDSEKGQLSRVGAAGLGAVLSSEREHMIERTYREIETVCLSYKIHVIVTIH